MGASTEALVDVESAGGNGLSQVLGLAGFTNADAVRNPSLDEAPYFARAELHQVIALGDDEEHEERTPLSLLTTLPARRIDLYLGEFSLVDFFDYMNHGTTPRSIRRSPSALISAARLVARA